MLGNSEHPWRGVVITMTVFLSVLVDASRWKEERQRTSVFGIEMNQTMCYCTSKTLENVFRRYFDNFKEELVVSLNKLTSVTNFLIL